MGNGYERLWNWFGLSYAGWLTLPRSLMHEMPDKWQNKMATLLEEYDKTFPNLPDCGTAVLFTESSKMKFIKGPKWLLNYRHPDKEKIKELKLGHQN